MFSKINILHNPLIRKSRIRRATPRTFAARGVENRRGVYTALARIHFTSMSLPVCDVCAHWKR